MRTGRRHDGYPSLSTETSAPTNPPAVAGRPLGASIAVDVHSMRLAMRAQRSDLAIRIVRQEEWWRHETGLLRFQNEVLKYIYYRLNY